MVTYDVYLRQAADDLCLQLGLLGLLASKNLFISSILFGLGPPKCDVFTLWTIKVLYVAVQV